MSNVNTDTVTLSLADEEVGPPFGVLPGTPLWLQQEPNAISKFGAEIKTTPREPISKNLQRLKGKTTDLDSGVSFTTDLTFEFLHRMLPQTLFAQYANLPDKGPVAGQAYYPTGVTATEYTVAADGDVPNGTLIFASGFSLDANNGFKVTAGGSTGVALKAAGLAIEVLDQPAQNASVYVCGVKGAVSDLTINETAGVVTLGSTILDFTKLGLSDGQFIRVGGADTDTFFTDEEDNGYARIAKDGISATGLILDKWASAPVDNPGTGKTIELFFGPFVHNVAVDDDLYLFVPIQVEATWPDLGGAGVPMYSYAEGNFIDQGNMELPITSKGGLSYVMIGTDTGNPTLSRADEAENAMIPVLTDTFNTSSEIVRLRATQLDETGMTSDFLSANLNIKNNVTPKKVLGTLGAKYINRGLINVSLEADVLFTDGEVVAAVRNNETVTLDAGFRNADSQGFFVDIPELTIGGAAPSFPAHDQVQLKCTFDAHRSVRFGYSVSFSLFPYLPDVD